MSRKERQDREDATRIVEFYGVLNDIEQQCYHFYQRGELVPPLLYSTVEQQLKNNIVDFQNRLNHHEKYALPCWLTYIYLKYDPRVRIADDLILDGQEEGFFHSVVCAEGMVDVDYYAEQMDYLGNAFARELITLADERRLLDLQVAKMAKFHRALHQDMKGHHYAASMFKKQFVRNVAALNTYRPTSVEDRVNAAVDAMEMTPAERRVQQRQAVVPDEINELMVISDQCMYKCMQEFTQHMQMQTKYELYELKTTDDMNLREIPSYSGWVAALFRETGSKTVDMLFKMRAYELFILPGMTREASISFGFFDVPEVSAQLIASSLYGSLYSRVSKRVATAPIHLWPDLRLGRLANENNYDWEIRTALIVSFFFFLFNIYHKDYFGKPDKVNNYILFDDNYMGVVFGALQQASFVNPYLVLYRRSWYLVLHGWITRFHGDYATEYALREWTKHMLGADSQLYDILSMVDEADLPVARTEHMASFTNFAPLREHQAFFGN